VGWNDAPANASDATRPAAPRAPQATRTSPASGSDDGAAERDEEYTDSDQDEEAVDEEL